MFKQVKSKLIILFTSSLLIILMIFILTLYFFVTGAIRQNVLNELDRYNEEENHEWVEELFEGHHDHLKYKPERNIFYYLFDQRNRLVKGEETNRNLLDYIENNKLHKDSDKINHEIEWKNAHLLLVKYPVSYDGRVIGNVILGMDITDEKHLIENIIWILILLTLIFSTLFAFAGYFFAGQAMIPIQKSYMTQKKFVSDASHELRTPLSIFYSSIEVLEKEEKPNLSSFGQEVLMDVKKEAELMHHLLNDLLFLARSDQSHLELEIDEVNLSNLLRDLLTRFSRIIPATITLKNDIDEDILIKGDSVRLQQIFYILLDNAREYTMEGSITCFVKSEDEKVIVTIKDTGSGIAVEDLSHIFDRFYRADPSRNRKGSGLGLSIAKTIVEAHGGEIYVNSELGKGTEFKIMFKAL